MKLRLKIKLMTGMLIFLIAAAAGFAIADDEGLFRKNVSYDVYIMGSNSGLTLLGDVEILGFENIRDKTFLVVKPSEFTLGNTKGFIDFDQVVAILPNRDVNLNDVGGKQIQFR